MTSDEGDITLGQLPRLLGLPLSVVVSGPRSFCMAHASNARFDMHTRTVWRHAFVRANDVSSQQRSSFAVQGSNPSLL